MENLPPKQPDVAVYITHSPPRKRKVIDVEKEADGKTRFETFDKGKIHLDKIERLLRFAKRNNLPVFWERMHETTDEPALGELLQKTGFKKDEIVFCHGSPEDIRRMAETRKIRPKRVLIAGFYGEWCCNLAANALASAFPKAELIAIKGDFNLSMMVNYHKGQTVAREKQLVEEYRKSLKESQAGMGIKTRKLTRALLRR
ncbi:MAG: hypothetical protein AABW72_02720 [archaeon]